MRETQATPQPKAAVIHILCHAPNSAWAIRHLYRLRKQEGTRFSLGFLCRQTKIPSTGYLSDVINGRRRLALKYWPTTARALGLNDDEAAVLFALRDLDHAKVSELSQAKRRLDAARKKLACLSLPMSDDASSLFFALDVFAAFGLFKGTPTRAQLITQFGGVDYSQAIDAALTLLHRHGVIAPHPGNAWTIHKPQVLFHPGADQDLPRRYIDISLQEAQRENQHWFRKRESAYFTSQAMSVRRTDFQRFIQQFRRNFDDQLGELETMEGDSLVRINVQLYPMITTERPPF